MSFLFVFLFEAFVMKVQFKLVIQNIAQICWLDLKWILILSLFIVKDFEIIFALMEMQFVFVVEQSRVGLLDPEDEGIVVLKNRMNCTVWHKFASQLTDSSSDRLG